MPRNGDGGKAYLDSEAWGIIATARRETGLKEMSVSQAVKWLARRAGVRPPNDHDA